MMDGFSFSIGMAVEGYGQFGWIDGENVLIPNGRRDYMFCYNVFQDLLGEDSYRGFVFLHFILFPKLVGV